MPDRQSVLVLLDLVQDLVSRMFGPDDDVLEIRIKSNPCEVTVLTDHGGRFRIDGVPSSN